MGRTRGTPVSSRTTKHYIIFLAMLICSMVVLFCMRPYIELFAPFLFPKGVREEPINARTKTEDSASLSQTSESDHQSSDVLSQLSSQISSEPDSFKKGETDKNEKPLTNEDKTALETFVKGEGEKEVGVSAGLQGVASYALKTYQSIPDTKLVKSGYQDLLGGVWMCVIQHPLWVDIVSVRKNIQDPSGSHVHKMRISVEEWTRQAKNLGFNEGKEGD